jgi:hypothetical protein
MRALASQAVNEPSSDPRRTLGALGEEIAARHLLARGFDAIGITLDGAGELVRLDHLEGAF